MRSKVAQERGCERWTKRAKEDKKERQAVEVWSRNSFLLPV